MMKFRKGRIKVQGNPDCVRDGFIESSGVWGFYRYDPKWDSRNWTVGHIPSGRMMVDRLSRTDAGDLTSKLGLLVTASFDGKGKPSADFQSQSIRVLFGFNKDLVPERLQHLAKKKGGSK